jgi:UbiD family decarboxylase
LRQHIHNVTHVADVAAQYPAPTLVENAPVQEVVLSSDELDVEALPIRRHFEGDAGRYISSGIVIARDPDTGRTNLSFHRMQVKGRNKVGISLHSRGDLWRYFQAAKARGQDLEIAVCIGCHPAYYITGSSRIPAPQEDYSWTSAYMNEAVQLTRAKTVDILVPAFAEFILEGHIKADAHEDEGPFGEFSGYSTSRSTRNILEVSCITRRHDAIYQDLVPGFAWEHLLLSQFTEEIILLDTLKKEIPQVKALAMPKNGCHFHAYISLDSKEKGMARQAMMLLFGLDHYLKLIVAVDDSVDVYDEQQVLWALATRVQADRDVFIVPRVICNHLDPSSIEGMSAKMGIDATTPLEADSHELTLPAAAWAEAKALLENMF